jgi:Flp pilus assembly protein TadB
MIGLTLIGCAIGAAIFFLIVQIRPPKPDPLVMLARFDQAQLPDVSARSVALGGPAAVSAETKLGRWVSTELARRGIAYTSLRQDLALNGQSFDTTMGRKVVVGVLGFLIGLIITVFLSVAGLQMPIGVPVIVALMFAVGFFFIPDFDARSAAQRRRREFKRALGAYLDWVSLQMSGKAAAEQALPEAAKIGSGWPLALIRHTVTNATRSGQDVWVALTELGDRIGVTPLRELGVLVQLVAHDGAQVRDTLSARAASLRAEELADAEGTAGKRDQSMLMAQILLGVGFAVFLGYPAITNFMRI